MLVTLIGHEYWTVYWFQSIACFVFATVAMFSGISGAALMLPWFVLGFALLGVPEITTQQAIVAALFLESAAFGIGIYRYHHRGFIDLRTAIRLMPVVIPTAIAGALAAHWASEAILHFVYATLMIGAAWLLVHKSRQADVVQQSDDDSGMQALTDAAGRTHRFREPQWGIQQFISGGGGILTGLISTGMGEITQPSLIVRAGYPVPIAAATSIVLVAAADIAAILTHIAQFVVQEGISDIPWNLIVWGMPGMAAGAWLGTHLQGRYSDRAAHRFFAGLFVTLGITFIIYTVLGAQ